MAIEDDRVVLLANDGDTVDVVQSQQDCLELRRTDPDGQFSIEEITDDNVLAQERGSLGKDLQQQEPSGIVYVAACVAAIGGLLFGYDIGIISGAKTQMQVELQLSCLQIESIVAMLPLGAFVASLLGGVFVDKYGRKVTIIVNAGIFIVGALTLSLTSNLFFLLLGRFVLGFAVALSAIAECIYISELSTPEKRGMLVSLNELAITVGILIAFLVNYCLAEVRNGWRVMFSLSVAAAIVQGIAMFFLPRTPQFLMICRKEAEAEATIRKLRISRNIRQTMADIRLSLADEEATGNACLCRAENNMSGRMFIGVGLVLAQQFTGQPNIIYYAADVFRAVGFCTEWSSTLASVGLGFMKVMSTVISLSIVDRIGRRKALISGIAVMGIAVFVLAIFAFQDSSASVSNGACHDLDFSNTTTTYLNDTLLAKSVNGGCPPLNASRGLRMVAFIALVSYVCAYSFGFGPVTWILLSEIFPPATKGRAMATATALNWAANVAVSASFLQVTAAFTLGGVFLVYAFMCVAGIVFVTLVVPETRNKTLEEISKELKNKKPSVLIKENLPWKSKRSQSSTQQRAAYSIVNSSVRT